MIKDLLTVGEVIRRIMEKARGVAQENQKDLLAIEGREKRMKG